MNQKDHCENSIYFVEIRLSTEYIVLTRTRMHYYLLTISPLKARFRVTNHNYHRKCIKNRALLYNEMNQWAWQRIDDISRHTHKTPHIIIYYTRINSMWQLEFELLTRNSSTEKMSKQEWKQCLKVKILKIFVFFNLSSDSLSVETSILTLTGVECFFF